MANIFSSGLNKVVNQVTGTLKESKTELKEQKIDINEEEDEINHLNKANQIVTSIAKSPDKFNAATIRERIGKAEEHLEQAREEEVEVIKRHETEIEQGKQEESELEQIESELEKLKRQHL